MSNFFFTASRLEGYKCVREAEETILAEEIEISREINHAKMGGDVDIGGLGRNVEFEEGGIQEVQRRESTVLIN